MFEKQNYGSSFSYVTFWNKNMMVGSYMPARLKDGNGTEHGNFTILMGIFKYNSIKGAKWSPSFLGSLSSICQFCLWDWIIEGRWDVKGL